MILTPPNPQGSGFPLDLTNAELRMNLTALALSFRVQEQDLWFLQVSEHDTSEMFRHTLRLGVQMGRLAWKDSTQCGILELENFKLL